MQAGPSFNLTLLNEWHLCGHDEELRPPHSHSITAALEKQKRYPGNHFYRKEDTPLEVFIETLDVSKAKPDLFTELSTRKGFLMSVSHAA